MNFQSPHALPIYKGKALERGCPNSPILPDQTDQSESSKYLCTLRDCYFELTVLKSKINTLEDRHFIARFLDKTCEGIELLICSNEDVHGISIVLNASNGFHHSYICNVFLLFLKNNDSNDVYSGYSFF